MPAPQPASSSPSRSPAPLPLPQQPTTVLTTVVPHAQPPLPPGLSPTLPVSCKPALVELSSTPPTPHMPMPMLAPPGLSLTPLAPHMPIGSSTLSIISHPGPTAVSAASRRRGRERKRGRKTSVEAPACRSEPPATWPPLASSGMAQAVQPGHQHQTTAPSPPASARSLIGSSDQVIAEPSGASYPSTAPSPSLPAQVYGPMVQLMAASHRWGSDEPAILPKPASQRAAALDEVHGLKELEAGQPAP